MKIRKFLSFVLVYGLAVVAFSLISIEKTGDLVHFQWGIEDAYAVGGMR